MQPSVFVIWGGKLVYTNIGGGKTKSLTIENSIVKTSTPKKEIRTALDIIKNAPRNSELRDTLNNALRSKFGQLPDSQYKVILNEG